MRAAEALARLPRCAGSSEPLLPAYAISNKISYSKICLKRPLKNMTKIVFQDQLSLNADQKYCRMLFQPSYSAILLTFIKLPFVIKMFVLSTFEWLLKTGLLKL